MKELLAVVITYNPSKDVISNIHSYLQYVDDLLIIDNSEKNNGILDILNDDKIIVRKNGRNNGISIALNEALREAAGKYKYLLTLDQDSYFSDDNFIKYREHLFLLDGKNACISPCFLMRNKKIKREIKYSNKKRCMTSGCILKVDVALKIGGFDETLFIDEVDHEFSYRLKKFGYNIVGFDSGVYMHHCLGEQASGIFKFRQHIPVRVYYVFRNKILVAKKYPKHYIGYGVSLIKKIIKIIFLESDKVSKLKFAYWGMCDGIKNVYGKIEDARNIK